MAIEIGGSGKPRGRPRKGLHRMDKVVAVRFADWEWRELAKEIERAEAAGQRPPAPSDLIRYAVEFYVTHRDLDAMYPAAKERPKARPRPTRA